MSTVLWVGAGGFLGSVARYLLGSVVQSAMGGAGFPFGTLAVNLIGCFVIGVLVPVVGTGDARAFLVVGVLGGFTTFSAFGHETLELLRGPHAWLGAVYVLTSVVLGVGAVAAGRALSPGP